MFILRHLFFLGVGLGLDMKWARVSKSFDPIINYRVAIFRLGLRVNGI